MNVYELEMIVNEALESDEALRLIGEELSDFIQPLIPIEHGLGRQSEEMTYGNGQIRVVYDPVDPEQPSNHYGQFMYEMWRSDRSPRTPGTRDDFMDVGIKHIASNPMLQRKLQMVLASKLK